MKQVRIVGSWRLVAGAALVLLGLAVLTALWLIIRNHRLAIILVVTCVCLATVVWRSAMKPKSGLSWPYVLLTGAAFVALADEAVDFVRDVHNVVLVGALLALLGLGGVLVTMLRRRYVRERSSVGLVPVGQQPVLIVNPKSGSGRALKAHIPELARAQGIRVHMLEPGADLVALVERAADGAGVIGMSGGDGSLGVAAAAAMRHDIPLVVLPGGTKCHFARDIGLDPANMADALRAFGGREARIDAAEVNGRVFLNNASFGVYADVVRQPNYRERKLQSVIDVMEQGNVSEGYPLSFQDEGGQLHDRAVMVLVGVNRYETVNVTELGSRRRLDEGVLQVNAVYQLDRSLAKQLAGIMRPDDSASKQSRDGGSWVAEEFMIKGDAPSLEVGVDGELVEMDSPVRLRVLPRQLRLMVPPEGIQQRRSLGTMFSNLKDYAFTGRLPDEH